MRGRRSVGRAGNTILCVPRLVSPIAGSARTYGATHGVTDLCHGDQDLQDPHLPGAHPGVPATPGFGHQEEFAQGPSHKHLTVRISQPPNLQSKETFVKESPDGS